MPIKKVDKAKSKQLITREVEVDLEEFQPSSSKGKSTNKAGSGVLSIINYKNGKRVLLSKSLTEELQHPESLQFSFNQGKIAIGEDLPENDNHFSIKSTGARGVIYSSSLVQEIAEQLALDFTDSTSITLQGVSYKTSGEKKVAIVTE